MRKFLIALGVLALFAAAVESEEFTLRIEQTRTPDHPALSLLFSSCSPLGECPPAVEPPAVTTSDPWYYRLRIADRAFCVVADSAVRTLYIDTDGDEDFTDEEALSGELAVCRGTRGVERALLFGPVELGGEDGVASVMAMLSETRRLQVFPSGFVTGEITLDGKTMPMTIVDANFDGRYDGAFSADGASDVLVADINGDSEISIWRALDGETAPLGRLLHAGDRYYAIKPAADGSSVLIEPAAPETGTIETGVEGAFMVLWSENGFHYLSSKDSAYQLPGGLYRARRVGFNGADGAGSWSITASDTGNIDTFTVQPGETERVTFGPPLTAKLDSYTWGDTVSTGIVIFGTAGERYPLYASLNGSNRPLPAIEIFLEDGEQVAHGRFEYG